MAAKKKTVTMRAKGKKPISFKEGGLHQATGTPAGQKIPASKVRAAAAGKYGPKAKKEAQFDENVLAKGRRTANANRKK